MSLTCCSWFACRISGTDTGRHNAWLRSVSSSLRATKLLPNRFWFIYRNRQRETNNEVFLDAAVVSLFIFSTAQFLFASPFWATEGFCSGNTGPVKTSLQCPQTPGERETLPAFLGWNFFSTFNYIKKTLKNCTNEKRGTNSLIMSSLLSPSCVSMVSLRIQTKTNFQSWHKQPRAGLSFWLHTWHWRGW